MHVVLLHYAAPPVIGGVEHVLARHADLMADAGHRVTVVAGRGMPWDPRIALQLVAHVDSRHPEILAVKADLDQGVVPHWLPSREIARFASKDLLRWTSDACLYPYALDPHDFEIFV